MTPALWLSLGLNAVALVLNGLTFWLNSRTHRRMEQLDASMKAEDDRFRQDLDGIFAKARPRGPFDEPSLVAVRDVAGDRPGSDGLLPRTQERAILKSKAAALLSQLLAFLPADIRAQFAKAVVGDLQALEAQNPEPSPSIVWSPTPGVGDVQTARQAVAYCRSSGVPVTVYYDPAGGCVFDNADGLGPYLTVGRMILASLDTVESITDQPVTIAAGAQVVDLLGITGAASQLVMHPGALDLAPLRFVAQQALLRVSAGAKVTNAGARAAADVGASGGLAGLTVILEGGSSFDATSTAPLLNLTSATSIAALTLRGGSTAGANTATGVASSQIKVSSDLTQLVPFTFTGFSGAVHVQALSGLSCTTAQLALIQSPFVGLEVYVTDGGTPGIFVWNGAAWVVAGGSSFPLLGPADSVAAPDYAWSANPTLGLYNPAPISARKTIGLAAGDGTHAIGFWSRLNFGGWGFNSPDNFYSFRGSADSEAMRIDLTASPYSVQITGRLSSATFAGSAALGGTIQGPALGSGGVTFQGNQLVHKATCTIGAGATTGTLYTELMSVAFSAECAPVLYPADDATALAMTTSRFSVQGAADRYIVTIGGTPLSAGTLNFYVHVFGLAA